MSSRSNTLILSLALTITAASVSINAQVDQGGASISIERNGDAHPYTHLRVNNDPDQFQFAIVTDRTGGHRPGVFEDAVKKLNLLQPEFIVSVGDMIEGYTRDEDVIYREWDEFNGFIEQLEMPFFYVPGNHDYINDVMARIWEEKYGPSYYHFLYKDVLFLCLNSEEARKGSDMGGIEKQQYEYVKKVLEDHPDVKWTLVFMHQPLWILDNTRYWSDVENLLKDRKHTVFAGHLHHYVKYLRNDSRYFILATTGGISQLRGPNFGEFDHLVWITMTDEGPVIANLLLEGIWHEDVVTEELIRMLDTERIKINPLFVEDVFEEGDLQLKITNNDNYPMHTLIRFGPHAKIYPEMLEFQKIIPPNSVEILEIPVHALGYARADEIDALTLYTWFSYQYKDRREIKLDARYGIAPVKKVSMERSSGIITVDGRLDEWTVFPFKGDNHSRVTGSAEDYQGDYDANYEFNVKYDDDFLYFGISVWDDELVVDRKASLWDQDVLEISLDARPVEVSSNGRGTDRGMDYVLLSFAPSLNRKNQPRVYQPEGLPEGTIIKTSRSVEGFSAEIAIPAGYLVKKGGANWESLRLNITYLDKDGSDSRSALWWRPDWSSDQNYIGSGTLFRED